LVNHEIGGNNNILENQNLYVQMKILYLNFWTETSSLEFKKGSIIFWESKCKDVLLNTAYVEVFGFLLTMLIRFMESYIGLTYPSLNSSWFKIILIFEITEAGEIFLHL